MGKANILELPNKTNDVGDSIGVATAMPAHDLIQLVCSTGIRHIVQRDGLSFEAEVAAAETMIQSPHEFLNDPIKVILGVDPVAGLLPHICLTVAAHEKKQGPLGQLEKFIESLQGSRAIRDQALVIADELFTNGSKNAWNPSYVRAEEGRPWRLGRVELFASADAQRLVFGCRDSFGELDMSRVLARIESCYQNGVAQSINQGKGGAGIGSFMVFDNCTSYYIGVERGKRTVACVSLPLGLKNREVSSLSKNIHLLSVA